LVVAPWVLRNRAQLGQAILTTTHGGYTLLLAHNARYAQEAVSDPMGSLWDETDFQDWSRAIEQAALRELAAQGVVPPSPAYEAARDAWMNERAWQFMREQPALLPVTALSLWSRFWSVAPSSSPKIAIPWAFSWGMTLFYIATYAGMARGAWRVVGDRSWEAWPAAALIVAFALVHAVYWADMRMRAPLVPAIALLAARGFAPRDQS
jgi:hypothetical protein